MRAIAIALACVAVCGCRGGIGPTGPAGTPGEDGRGYEFQQFHGVVPTTGLTTVTIPFLDIDCPPLVMVYIQTETDKWITATILDNFEENGEPMAYLEIFVLHDGSVEIASGSALSFNRPIPFIITILAPEGYFESGYQCP